MWLSSLAKERSSLSLIQAIDAAPAERDLAHATLDDLRLRLAAHPDGLFRAACRGGGSALLWTLADRGCVSITALVEDQAPACSPTAVQTNSPAFTVCIDLIQRCPWRVSTKSIGPSTISTIDRSAGAPGCRGAEPGHAVYRLGRRRRRQGHHLLEWQAEVQELAHHPGQELTLTEWMSLLMMSGVKPCWRAASQTVSSKLPSPWRTSISTPRFLASSAAASTLPFTTVLLAALLQAVSPSMADKSAAVRQPPGRQRT